jgi:hypothetical protein
MKRIPANSVVLQVRVHQKIHDELHALARNHDLTLAQVLRRLCTAALREGKISELA